MKIKLSQLKKIIREAYMDVASDDSLLGVCQDCPVPDDDYFYSDEEDDALPDQMYDSDPTDDDDEYYARQDAKERLR